MFPTFFFSREVRTRPGYTANELNELYCLRCHDKMGIPICGACRWSLLLKICHPSLLLVVGKTCHLTQKPPGVRSRREWWLLLGSIGMSNTLSAPRFQFHLIKTDKKPRFHFHLTKRRKDGGDFEGFVIFSARNLSLETGTMRGKVLPIVRLTTTRYLCKIIILEMFFISITYQYIYLSETHYHHGTRYLCRSIILELFL